MSEFAGTPNELLFDESFAPTLVYGPPNARITIQAQMIHRNAGWAAEATYRSDDRGRVDLRDADPLAGTYATADPMGLCWSMRRVGDAAAVAIAADGDIDAERVSPVTFRAYHDGAELAAATVRRVHRRPTVRRRNADGSPAQRYLEPAGGGPHPGVVLLGGSEGGHPPSLPASILASRGYAVLSLAYFGADGRPATLERIDLAALERAVDRFAARRAVRAAPLGIMGWSRGAELALLLATRLARVRTAVAWAPSHVAFDGIPDGFRRAETAWVDGDRPLPSISYAPTPRTVGRILRSLCRHRAVELAPLYRDGVAAASVEQRAEAAIPVERIGGPVLFVSGGDDRLWPAASFADRLVERLDDRGYPSPFDHRCYPDAGHLLGVAHRPTAASTTGRNFLPGIPLALGGTPAANARANADAWRRALRTLACGLR
ncbi:acyl-CoA thioester hydrolase/BAAT C-terminal domain-containing protein [Haloferacaceae archaeon DSL9]